VYISFSRAPNSCKITQPVPHISQHGLGSAVSAGRSWSTAASFNKFLTNLHWSANCFLTRVENWENPMKRILILLTVFLTVSISPAQAQTTAESGSASHLASSSRTFFPHNWVRGYTDFSVAPSHNEPDLGRCMFSQAGQCGRGGFHVHGLRTLSLQRIY